MPAFRNLKDQDIQNLAAHFRSLRTPPNPRLRTGASRCPVSNDEPSRRCAYFGRTSTIVKAERRGHSVAEMLTNVREACGETEIVLSVVTIAELTHGVYRAKLETHRQMRQAFIEELKATLTVHPITVLQLGYEIPTENVRHFEKIPGLIVRPL